MLYSFTMVLQILWFFSMKPIEQVEEKISTIYFYFYGWLFILFISSGYLLYFLVKKLINRKKSKKPKAR